jgi:hypothetical protein
MAMEKVLESNPMDGNTSNKIQIYRELKKLQDDLLEIQQELKRAKSKSEKEKLKDLINDLKMDLGWKLFDCGEYEKGLALSHRSLERIIKREN